MNTKFYNLFSLMIVIGLTFVACSQDDEVLPSEAQVETVDEAGNHYYQMELNCAVPAYEEDEPSATNRAMSYTWSNGDKLFLIFKSATSTVSGTATYNSSKNTWGVTTPASLPITKGEANCEVYYFKNAGSVTSSVVTMTEQTSCFYTTTATYKHPSADVISMTASLQPKTWRLRFKGEAGTTISLSKVYSDIVYYTRFDCTTGKFTSAKKDVDLTVKTAGSTPYIYGEFANASGQNMIGVYSDYVYTRQVPSSVLQLGGSGYYNIPSEADYESWDFVYDAIIPHCTATPKLLLPFTDGMATQWSVERNVDNFYYAIYKKSYIEENHLSEDEIIADILRDNEATTSDCFDYTYRVAGSLFFTANTEYYLYSIAFNRANDRGDLVKTSFKTKSTSLPIAEISNITASSTYWNWRISLKNSAAGYYIWMSENEVLYNEDDYFIAHAMYKSISERETTDSYTITNPNYRRNGDQFLVMSYAFDSSKKLGNYSVGRKSTYLFAKERDAVQGNPNSDGSYKFKGDAVMRKGIDPSGQIVRVVGY